MSEKPAKEALVFNPSLIVEMALHVTRRGHGPTTTSFMTQEQPELARFLLQATDENDDGESLKIPKGLVSFLKQAGVLIPRSEIPGPVEFDFFLPLAPPALLPRIADDAADDAADPRELIVSTGVHWSDEGSPPASLPSVPPKAEFTAGAGPVLWVEEPGTGMVVPYRVPTAVAPAVRRLVEGRGQPLGQALDAWKESLGEAAGPLLQVLRLAHAVLPRGHHDAQEGRWRERVERCREQLRREQYTVVEDMFSPLQLALLRQYYRDARLAGALSPRDRDVALRSVRHNETITTFLHHQTTALLNRIIASPTVASYCFLAAYEPGAVLPRHVDRPQCRWNLSVPFDADPETDRTSAWPIYVEVEGEAREVRLGLGDGVLYSGTTLPHWRNAQPEGHRCTVSFFHYVDEGFTGSLD